jgi:hypothetical protein
LTKRDQLGIGIAASHVLFWNTPAPGREPTSGMAIEALKKLPRPRGGKSRAPVYFDFGEAE